MAAAKEVTICDIAEKLKILPATVSRGLQDHRAISRKTKKRISDFADEIGYRTNHFARNLRNRKTNTIGVIVPRLNSNFMSPVIAGMEHVANHYGYSFLISQSSETASFVFVGFNNDPVPMVIEPNLTTINYSGYEMGQVAERHLINHLNGTLPINNTTTIIRRSELIIRQSSLKNQ